MYHRSALTCLLATFSANLLADAFAPLPTNFQKSTLESSLHAKAKTKKKKNKATTTRTGGFGTVVEKKAPQKKKEVGDYAAFPALQQQVKATLVPAFAEDRENAGQLIVQLLERLDQIYGFPDFNFPEGHFDKEEKEDDSPKEESMSFDELLSGGTSTPKPSSVSSDFGDLLKPKTDFVDLIASASGGSVKTPEAGSSKSSKNISVENLPQFDKFRVLHVDPMVLAVDDFFTDEECDEYVAKCTNPTKRTSNNDMPMMSSSKTVGNDSIAKAQRTSTTWFHHFKSVPELMAKASRLLGLRNINRWEEPQTVRYQPGEKFTWHLDAFTPSDRLTELGGQRVATLLVYLTDMDENTGGATQFRDLGFVEGEFLKVEPKKGTALLFFPAAGGIPETPFDIRTLHAGEAVSVDATKDKWIAQMWLRELDTYTPSAPPGNSHSMGYDASEEYCKNAK